MDVKPNEFIELAKKKKPTKIIYTKHWRPFKPFYIFTFDGEIDGVKTTIRTKAHDPGHMYTDGAALEIFDLSKMDIQLICVHNKNSYYYQGD